MVGRIAMGLCVFLVVSLAQQATEKLVGTWKLDTEKSKLPNFTSRTLKTERIGPNTFRTEADLVLKSGERDHSVTTQVCDGIERPKEGAAKGVTEVCTPDATVLRKQDGKIISEMRSVFSADGRVQTITHRKLNKDGTWSEAVGIYTKQ